MSSRARIDAHAHVFPKISGRIGRGVTRGARMGTVHTDTDEIQAFEPIVDIPSHSAEMLVRAMDFVGVEKAFLLQGPFYGECNAFAADAASKFPERLAAAAFVDPWEKGFADQKLEAVLSGGAFSAVKLECSVETGFFGLHEDASLAQKNLEWFWSMVEQKRLVLVLDLGSIGSRAYETSAVDAIARSHPALRIVICHLAHPTALLERDQEARKAWLDQIELGRLPNVWFDAAALPGLFETEQYPYAAAQRWFLEAVSIVGARKILWGTDTPGTLIQCTYRQLMDLGEHFVADLSEQERTMIMYSNAEELYFSPYSKHNN